VIPGRLVIVLLVVFTLAACGKRHPPSPGDRVTLNVTTATRYYSIRGETARAIFDSLEQQSPKDDKGRRAGGLTSSSWRLDWVLQDSPAGCRPYPITIALDLVVTLPEHERLNRLPEDLRANWQRLVARIAAHEQRHVEIYLDGAKTMKSRFEAISSKPSCTALQKELDRVWVDQKAATERAQDRFHVEDDARVANDRRPLRAQIDAHQVRLTTIESEIRALDRTRAGLKRQLETARRRMDAVRDEIADAGGSPSTCPGTRRGSRVWSLCERHGSLVEAHNGLVSQHNNVVTRRTTLVGEHDRMLAATNRLREAYNWTW